MNHTTPTSAELLPCPFCGTHPIKKVESLDERFGYANRVTIRCGSCGASKSATGDTSKGGYADNSTTEERAIAAWNRRAAMQPGEPVASERIANLEGEKEISDAVIAMMSRILASIAITLKGEEAALKRHSYHDLPELVKVMALELDLYKTIYGDKVPEGWENGAAPDRAPSADSAALDSLLDDMQVAIGNGFSCADERAAIVAYVAALTRPSADNAAISRDGRVLADRSADACGVDRDDNWKIYGLDFIEDTKAAIAALHPEEPSCPS